MRLLLKNGTVVNCFIDALEKSDVLIEDGKIVGVGDYSAAAADVMEDVSGKIICPGFIDGHIHIESSMLQPAEFARVCLPHGTTSIMADPHEVANVAGLSGIMYMLGASEGIPLCVYLMIPSCVPATPFDEAGAVLKAENIRGLFASERVLGLGEMMNFPGVLANDPDVMRKIDEALKRRLIVNGHAPLLTGEALDRYISAGIFDDHESSSLAEAQERVRKGQWVMIRQGTVARNLDALMDMFDEPWNRRCLLVTDDKHPADLMKAGHIDGIIRTAIRAGKSPLAAIRMASLQAAQCFGIRNKGAVAPGHRADLLVLNDLESVDIRDVYCGGVKTVSEGGVIPFEKPFIRADIWKTVRNSFYLDPLNAGDFMVEPRGSRCRVIRILPGQLITKEWIADMDLDSANGIDTGRDILKLAVVERHMNSGHIGLGYVNGLGLKRGAIASSVSHDSHNLIIVGADHGDMAVAANRVREMCGGLAVAENGRIIAEMPLPICGLISKKNAADTAADNEDVRRAVHALGAPEGVEPFMNLAFVSLPVIPDIKMTTHGLVDVNSQRLLDLFA